MSINLLVIFLTGLTVGGLGCVAVQGGLLASAIASREQEDTEEGKKEKHNLWPTFAFLTTKFIAYILLGFALGAFGSALQISDWLRIAIQIVAGVYMILVAANLLNIHPVFRYVLIQPPRFLTKIIRSKSKSGDLFTPALLGVLTIFLPCGTTLAMEALAISSGSALLGAMILGVFVLGTAPIFFGIGAITTLLGDTLRQNFFKVAAVIIIYLGLTSINFGLLAAGSPLAVQNLIDSAPRINNSTNQPQNGASSENNSIQNIGIQILGTGYSPNYIQVKKGIPVRLTVRSDNIYSCALAFRIPSLNVALNLKPTDSQTTEFTPQSTGQIPFGCSMWMFRGVIEVI